MPGVTRASHHPASWSPQLDTHQESTNRSEEVSVLWHISYAIIWHFGTPSTSYTQAPLWTWLDSMRPSKNMSSSTYVHLIYILTLSFCDHPLFHFPQLCTDNLLVPNVNTEKKNVIYISNTPVTGPQHTHIHSCYQIQNHHRFTADCWKQIKAGETFVFKSTHMQHAPRHG